jgi:hypothetical protein
MAANLGSPLTATTTIVGPLLMTTTPIARRCGSPMNPLDGYRPWYLCIFTTCGVFRWFGGGGFVFGQPHGFGAGVVVEAVAPVFRHRLLRWCVVSIWLVVDPCGAQLRGWRVVSCCNGFWPVFLINVSNSFLQY